MRKMELAEIQRCELDMLKHFIKVCDRYHLRYYLAGGTLLGAIRHKGFIPWDDDIDVLMPRSDYDKLQKLAPEINTERFFLASNELGNLNYPFSKLFDKETLIQKTYDKDEYEQHLWIDIFPLDGLPSDKQKITKIYKKSLYYRKQLNIQRSQDGEAKSRFKKILKPIIKRVLLSCVGITRAVEKIDCLAKEQDFEKCEKIGGIVWGYGPQECMTKAEYLPVVKVQFEDLEVNAPGCWKKYLTALYGDYMQLPPPEKRVTHDMNAWIKD